MTIPTLIANVNSSKYRSQFKKTISTLSQVARMSEAQYGFDYSGITQQCGVNAKSEHPENVMTICAIINAALTGINYYESASDIPMRKQNGNVKYSVESPRMTAWGRSLATLHAYTLADGTVFMFSKDLGKYPCSIPLGSVLQDNYTGNVSLNHCVGFIDVNGTMLPNKEVSCSSGDNSLSKNNCVVKNDAKHMTDIYPVRIHDGVVEPATAAARYVLRTAK